MFQIGKFSKISRLPVRTLRYYDQIGLRKADHVNPFTGCRYSDLSLRARFNRILALKDLDLTLEQTALMLDEGLSLDRLRDTLRRKRAELELNARLVEPRLERVEARLWQIELEGTMPDYENNIKELPPLRVASVRGIILTYPQQGQLWAELEKEMRRQGVRSAGACFTRYLDSEYRDRNIQAGVCYRILGECADRGQMAVRELPGGSTSTTDP